MSYELVSGRYVGEWVAAQIEGAYGYGCSQAIGLAQNGKLVAGIIYEDWNGKSVVCHLAIHGRITREWLHVISRYAFDQLGVHKIIAPAYSDNHQSLAMLKKMGFIEEGRIRDAQPSGDILIFTMTKQQCPYLSERYHGKKSPSACNA